MEIGQLSKRITIRKKTLVSDNEGSSSESWSDLKTVWAKAEAAASISGYGSKLGNAYMQFLTQYTYRFTIRYDSQIEAFQRVVYNSKTFEIQSIENLGERDEYLRLYCKEVASGV